jgi:hypothetical protein
LEEVEKSWPSSVIKTCLKYSLIGEDSPNLLTLIAGLKQWPKNEDRIAACGKIQK